MSHKAQSYALRRMLDEATYFSLLYARWADDRGWDVVMPLFFGDAPALLRNLISGKIRKGVIGTLWSQGTSRHTQEEIYGFAKNDLSALNAILGDSEWFFGADKPGLLDIWVHSFVINVIVPPIENEVKAHCLTLDKLCEHSSRFQNLVYNN